MQPYPHHYEASALAGPSGDAVLSSQGLPDLPSAPPAEFDGPGDKWSPETLLLAAVADCYVLTFRAVARGAKLSYRDIRCTAKGKLDRQDRVTKFVEIQLDVTLTLPPEVEEEAALRACEKAERSCLISASLGIAPSLKVTIARR